jgi:hypothetical protein
MSSRVLLAVLIAVEVEQHGRVARDRMGEIGVVAERELPEEIVLTHHQRGRDAAVDGAREMIVPEIGHPLDERVRRLQHAVDPPRHGGDECLLPLFRSDRRAERKIAVGQRRQRVRTRMQQCGDDAVQTGARCCRDIGRRTPETCAPEEMGGKPRVPRPSVRQQRCREIDGAGRAIFGRRLRIAHVALPIYSTSTRVSPALGARESCVRTSTP